MGNNNSCVANESKEMVKKRSYYDRVSKKPLVLLKERVLPALKHEDDTCSWLRNHGPKSIDYTDLRKVASLVLTTLQPYLKERGKSVPYVKDLYPAFYRLITKNTRFEICLKYEKSLLGRCRRMVVTLVSLTSNNPRSRENVCVTTRRGTTINTLLKVNETSDLFIAWVVYPSDKTLIFSVETERDVLMVSYLEETFPMTDEDAMDIQNLHRNAFVESIFKKESLDVLSDRHASNKQR